MFCGFKANTLCRIITFALENAGVLFCAACIASGQHFVYFVGVLHSIVVLERINCTVMTEIIL
jgi:hypothetical protein